MLNNFHGMKLYLNVKRDEGRRLEVGWIFLTLFKNFLIIVYEQELANKAFTPDSSGARFDIVHFPKALKFLW